MLGGLEFKAVRAYFACLDYSDGCGVPRSAALFFRSNFGR